MTDLYYQLLDAAIDQLKTMKGQGQKYVCVAPESLKALAEAPPGLPTKRIADRRQSKVCAPEASSPAANLTASNSAVQSPASDPRTTVSEVPRPASSPCASPSLDLGFAAAAVQPATPLDPQEKAERFAALRQRAMICQKCPHLAKARKNVVFGVGSLKASLMFVGEAPGADEDEQGEPFVGKAGQLLTKIIQAMGLSRETVYIGNILKCRPDTPGQSAGNRKPTADEMKTCLPYLLEQIELIRPKVIVALGATAVEGLLGLTGITKLRGHFQDFHGVPVMPTYHPAFLLRNQAISVKREVWEDMLKVMEKLGMSISEKQRNFFLPKEA